MAQHFSLLLIFVKHPQIGKVKTRLAAGIGEDQALAAYQELLEYTQSVVAPLEVDKAVFYSNMTPKNDLWLESGYVRYLQEGRDLGARMQHAFEWGFERGYAGIVIIGSDCATISTEILRRAFIELYNHDFVIGPARDGGYYLLGMRDLEPALFAKKKWSTGTVLSDTLADIGAAGKTLFKLPELSDIDTIDDLAGTFLEKYLPDHSKPEDG